MTRPDEQAPSGNDHDPTIEERQSVLLAAAALFDDPTLEHLANKGLVRRARKLLGARPRFDATAKSLEVTADSWCVRFEWSAPLSKGTCDCATSGICQHVIAAILALRETTSRREGAELTSDGSEPGSVPPGQRVHEALVAIADDELVRWAKTADTRWAVQRLASIDPTEIVVFEDGHVSVELPLPHATVRFMAPSLDSAIVKPSTKNDRRSVVLSILALWLTHGRELRRDETDVVRRTELPGERAAVVTRAGRVCCDLLAIGLLHLGDAERERLDSLAASARGVKLYRLALLAERAADQADALAQLSTDADTGRLLDQLAEIAVVAETIEAHLATGHPIPDGLCGTARARYEPVGQLRMVGLGHHDWGDHRFAGTTGLFATSASRFFTVARPRVVNGRSLPEALGWTGVSALPSLTGKQVTLSDAKASHEGRLSASATTTAAIGAQVTEPDLLRLVWRGERPVAPSRLLGRNSPHWTVLGVDAQVSPPVFDTIKQQLEWALTSAGATVVITMPYRPASAAAILNLEHIAAAGVPDYVVGRLRAEGPSLTLWPISIMVDGTLQNLTTPARPGDNVAPEPPDPSVGVSVTIDHLDHLAARLVRVADGGRRPATPADLLALAKTADDWGYPVLQQVITSTSDSTVSVLRGAWALQLLRDAESGSPAPQRD